MVDAGRADFLLTPFQNSPGMVIKMDKIVLIPLPGKKVNIKDSCHFAISKKHPHSLKIQNALDRGIRRMNNAGLITKAYKEAGFFHPAIDHWQVLYSKKSSTTEG